VGQKGGITKTFRIKDYTSLIMINDGQQLKWQSRVKNGFKEHGEVLFAASWE
jgi:Cu/Ag efflux protein CusF